MASSLNEIKKNLPANCQIVAVSKFQSLEKIQALYKDGQRIFAENYVQEARQKQQQLLDSGIRWHFIGKIQKNKLKDIVGNFELIHSVESLEHIEKIDKLAAAKNISQNVLIQMNLALEPTKAGISEENVSHFFEKIYEYKNVKTVGLMTMPPLCENPEETRPYFQGLRKILTTLKKNNPELRELSMGTSLDYKIAAEEGATYVRLGTVLFGERQKK